MDSKNRNTSNYQLTNNSTQTRNSSTKNTNPNPSKKKKYSTKINKKFLTVFVFLLIFVNIIGVGAALGIVKSIVDAAPEIDSEKIAPKGFTTIIYDQDGNELQRLSKAEANRIYVELDKIPEHLQKAVVAIEDERFWEHKGVDLRGLIRATVINVMTMSRKEGASTITQQLIKNNVLTNEKTFDRKIKEQYLALKIEKVVEKDFILENYLNTIPLGHATNGVQSATKFYFNKDVSELTIAESALLASIIKSPKYYSPIDYRENSMERKKIVLKKMLQQEIISQSQYAEALQEDVYAKIDQVKETRSSSTSASSSSYTYFVDSVIRNVKEDLVASGDYTDQSAYTAIYSGGLKIYATQDLKMQKIVDDVVNSDEYYPPKDVAYGVTLAYELYVKAKDGSSKTYSESKLQSYFRESDKNFDLLFDSEEEANECIAKFEQYITESGETIDNRLVNFTPQPQASFTVVDYHTGQVKAIAGGRGQKKGKLTLNRAADSTRQPGSCFKVLAAFLPAIDHAGMTLASIIDDVPYKYADKGRNVKNWYDDGKYTYNYRGLSTIREGIAYSMNIVAVKTLALVGKETAFKYLLDLGFTTLVESSDINESLCLGGITNGITNLELTSAYGSIANSGKYNKPVFYTKVLDQNGKVVLENQPENKRVMKETSAFLLTNGMESVVDPRIGTAPTANLNNLKIAVAGKTGTTTGNNDIWFTGFTPYYAASVWMGYDISHEVVFAREGSSGVSYHKLIWHDIMEKIHENLPPKQFEKPNGIVKATICVESGKLATPGLCEYAPNTNVKNYPNVREEFFTKDTVPREYCDVHVRARICTESGKLATDFCPPNLVKEGIFIKRPEPIDRSLFDKTKGAPRIADAKYSLPSDSENDYCPIHSPNNPNWNIDLNNLIPNSLNDLFNNHNNQNQQNQQNNDQNQQNNNQNQQNNDQNQQNNDQNQQNNDQNQQNNDQNQQNNNQDQQNNDQNSNDQNNNQTDQLNDLDVDLD